MKKFVKKLIKWLFIIILLILTAYGVIRLYNYVVKDITARIKKGVSEGVSETVNPLKWPKKIF